MQHIVYTLNLFFFISMAPYFKAVANKHSCHENRVKYSQTGIY